MSKNNLSQVAQMRPGKASKRQASLNYFEKHGDSNKYMQMLENDRKERMRKGYKGSSE